MEVPQSASSAPLSAIQKQKKHFGDHCHSKCDCLPAAQKAAGTDESTISNPDLTEQVGKWTKITKPKTINIHDAEDGVNKRNAANNVSISQVEESIGFWGESSIL